MAQVVVCRICLRANVGARDIPEFLVELHDEFCDYDVNDDKFLKFCAICEHLLRKFHEFRKRCQEANKVLIKWNRNKNRPLPENLHKLLPAFPLGVSDNITRRKVYECLHYEPDDDILSPIYTATIDKDGKNICITEKIDDTETVLEKIGFEEILQENSIIDDDILSNQSDCNSENDYLEVLDDELLSDKTLAELDNEDDDLLMQRLEFIRDKGTLKERILNELDTGQFNDLSDNVKMTKELFNKIYEKYNINDCHMLKPDGQILPDKLKKFLVYLHRKYNPEYETVFDIEYLDTEKKMSEEFNRRKDGRSYLDAPLKCELCYKGFATQGVLDYHNKWHTPTPNDVVCDICQMRFPNRRKYKTHRRRNHTAVYTCRICPMVIYDLDVMFNHFYQHKGAVYQCPVCFSVFSNQTTMNNHRRQVHATSHICSTCARTFVSDKGLYYHRKRKHKDEAEADPAEAALCSQCNITFDSQEVYLRHVRLTHKPPLRNKQPRCRVCREFFSSIEALRKHKLDSNHLRVPRQSCPSVWTPCAEKRTGRKVPTPRQRYAEKKEKKTARKDPIPRQPYRKCPECQVEVPCTYAFNLYKHYIKEHPNIPYITDTGKNNYLCEQCGKTFRVKSVYEDHRNKHTGAKPYVCEQCPSKFASSALLWVHNERHRAPSQQCKVCGKMFRSKANLYLHSRIHIGDRRFKCEICFKGFLHAATLREHVNGVHKQIRRKRRLRKTDKNLAVEAKENLNTTMEATVE